MSDIADFIKHTPTSEKVYDTGDPNKYGRKYSSLVSSNPYANMNYRPSFWQGILTSLGFRTNYDAYKESLQLQAQEYDAQIANIARQEEYDSALSQVERQRAAGINPDIVGDVDAGSSASMQDDGNPPIAPESDFAQISGFASMVMDAVSMAKGLAETGFQFTSMFTDLKGKKIDNDNKLLNTAFSALLGVTSPEDLDNFMNSDLSVQANNYMPSLSEVFGHRRAKKYVSAVNRLARGLTGHELEMKSRGSYIDSFIDYFRKTAGGEDAGFSQFADVMKVLNEELSKNLWNNLKAGVKLEFSEIMDKQMYEDTRLNEGIPSEIAENEGYSSGYRTQGEYMDYMLKKQQHTLMSSYEGIQRKLSSMADSGNWFASLVSIGLTWLMSRFSGGFMMK